MDPGVLHQIAAERRSRWAAADVAWEVVDGRATDKPAARLVLRGAGTIGQLTVWVTGEAEMEWVTQDDGAGRHYDLHSSDDLGACVTDLEDELRLT